MSSLNRIIYFYSKNDFENYKSFKKNYKKKIIYDEQFIQWFIGFYEHTYRLERQMPSYTRHRKFTFHESNHELCYFKNLLDNTYCHYERCSCNIHSYFRISKNRYTILERLWIMRILNKYLNSIFPNELLELITKYIPINNHSILDLVMYQWILSNHLEEYIPNNYSNLHYLFNLKKMN